MSSKDTGTRPCRCAGSARSPRPRALGGVGYVAGEDIDAELLDESPDRIDVRELGVHSHRRVDEHARVLRDAGSNAPGGGGQDEPRDGLARARRHSWALGKQVLRRVPFGLVVRHDANHVVRCVRGGRLVLRDRLPEQLPGAEVGRRLGQRVDEATADRCRWRRPG